jgi:ABC-type transporter Mla subunit MlaD
MSILSPKDRDRLSQLETLSHRLRHANALVEQFASAPAQAEQFAGSLRRTFSQLKMQFTTAGFDRLALMCGGLEQTARRGMSHGPKTRALRDALGTLTRQIDVERRSVATTVKRGQDGKE